MAILNFSDVLKNVGLNPKRVKLIRHSLGDKAFKKCYDKNMVEEYTRVQSETFGQRMFYNFSLIDWEHAETECENT